MIPALVPTSRVAPLLRDWLDAREERTQRTLAAATGVPERRIYAILTGEQESVQFHTADRLLCGIGATEQWHLALADVYESEPQALEAEQPRA
jgi:plasmid maintenance system antidote protein VapI